MLDILNATIFIYDTINEIILYGQTLGKSSLVYVKLKISDYSKQKIFTQFNQFMKNKNYKYLYV